MSDPVTTGLVVAGTIGILKQGQDFITAVSGHPGESLGTILGNLGKRRFQNLESVGNRAYLILLNLGVNPQEIPLPILQPALEGASVQEDPYLQDTWANLLANAADPRQRSRVEPSFAAILRLLSAREVQFLDELVKQLNGLTTIKLSLRDLINTFERAGLTHSPLNTGDHHLRDLYDLLRGEDRAECMLMMEILELNRILVMESGNIDNPGYRVTTLGVAFVRACQKPTA